MFATLSIVFVLSHGDRRHDPQAGLSTLCLNTLEFSFLAVGLSKVNCPATNDTNGFTVYLTVYDAYSDERPLYHEVWSDLACRVIRRVRTRFA